MHLFGRGKPLAPFLAVRGRHDDLEPGSVGGGAHLALHGVDPTLEEVEHAKIIARRTAAARPFVTAGTAQVTGGMTNTDCPDGKLAPPASTRVIPGRSCVSDL